mgnify:CR=1 FL=1|jgi:hypothetical protein
MKERITHTGESLGGSLIWAVACFSLIVFAAPLSWIGESLGDLRWHVGLSALGLSLLGMIALPRKRLGFACLLGLSLYNLFPALRVYMPSTAETFNSGTDITLVQVRWEEDPPHALEDKLLTESADIVVLTGVSNDARKSLVERLLDWPYSIAWPQEKDELDLTVQDDSSTLVFSKLPLSEPQVTNFGTSAIFMEALVEFDGPPVVLRVVDLPPPGPGDQNSDREALLAELENRPWPLRTILAIDLGASDTSLAYDRVRELGNFSDARQGIGRQATFAASIGGLSLPGMSVPREFTFVGNEVQVLDRFSQSILATDREKPLFRGSNHNAITTRLRVVD